MYDNSHLTNKDWDILKEKGITPNNLTIDGWLHLSNSNMENLPYNVIMNGYLDLQVINKCDLSPLATWKGVRKILLPNKHNYLSEEETKQFLNELKLLNNIEKTF